MRVRPFVLAALAGVCASAAQARGVSVPLNHSIRLPLSGPAQSVVVGSPSVVDVAVVDSRNVYLSGKSPGETDVTVIDPLGRVIWRGNVAVAGGAPVSVFRGSARTDATCAPACHDLQADQAAAMAPMLSGAMAGGLPTPTAGTTTTVMSSQTVSSLPTAARAPLR